MEEIKVSMIGVDGRVRWIDQARAKEMMDRGWQYIQNPKETYYPQYDQTSGVKKPKKQDEVVNVFTVENANDKLGIIIL